jgi:hypothetical protein
VSGVTGAPTVRIGQFDGTADAAAILLNGQSNYGGVAASVGTASYGVPLNLGTVPFATMNVAVSGNSALASAYGNVASNQLTVASTGRLPTAALVNVQANYGPVTAQVTGASYRVVTGPMSGGSLSVTGNQLGAIATGNQAASIITAGR